MVLWINQTEKIFCIVFIFGTVVFIYYFFIVPPEPVYYKFNPREPPPRDAIYLPDGRIIVGYERPSAVYVAPVAIMFYFFMIIITAGGRVRLREIISIRDGLSNLKIAVKKKISEGKQEYRNWKKK